MLYFIIIVSVFLLDQVIKQHMDKTRALHKEDPIMQGRIIVTKYYNKGAFLGFLKNRKYVLALMNYLTILGLVLYFLKLFAIRGNSLLKLAVSLIIGGALSNGYDRVKRKHVVDYFSFSFLKKVVFNLADMFIFIGGVMMLLHSFMHKK